VGSGYQPGRLVVSHVLSEPLLEGEEGTRQSVFASGGPARKSSSLEGAGEIVGTHGRGSLTNRPRKCNGEFW
jgi:hypothetical protein